MPVKDIVKTLRRPNYAIFNGIRDKASTEFQARIPAATKGSIRDSVAALHEYTPLRNEFIDALYNKIGQTIIRSKTWSNPLSIFKIGMMTYGDTIEEINIGLLDEYTYDPDRDSLERDVWGQERPEVQTSYHKINRQAKFKVTVNEGVLMRAFDSGSGGYGLADFITREMDALVTSDNWNEFLVMCSLFREYEDNGGFFNVQVPDLTNVDADSADARTFTRKIRAYAENLGFLSRQYNAAGMPVFAQREDLVLFMTPEARATMDVEALAAAFNIDKADVNLHTITIPAEQWNMPGTQAILTTKDFFVVADNRIEMAEIFNPDGLYKNYWLHHWQIISVSRFVPAIRFSTDPTTVIPVEDIAVATVTASVLDMDGDTVTDVERNGVYQVDFGVTPEGAPDGIILSVEGAESTFTKVTRTGVLVIGHNETAATLNVVATSSEDATKTATVALTVSGDVASVWNPVAIIPEATAEAE